jgi:nitroimidazol reductase NimA-like FMN-containing flavoprotein (pyridoxamine 5'-phosphate oxidase superfamily)
MQAIDERTGLELLDEEESWRLLRAGVVGRLAVAVGRRVDIFPVNYLVHRGGLLVRTVAGTKLAGAVLGGPVAFEVDDVDPVAGRGWSVVAHGRAEELTRLEAVFDAEDTGLEAWALGRKDRWLAIHVEDVSGRRLPERARPGGG